jgi:hypothetical protein
MALAEPAARVSVAAAMRLLNRVVFICSPWYRFLPVRNEVDLHVLFSNSHAKEKLLSKQLFAGANESEAVLV